MMPSEKHLTSRETRSLTNSEKQQFQSDGYIKNLPVFSDVGVKFLQELFRDFENRLPNNIDINQTNMWHKFSLSFYKLCRLPAILDYVEGLIGPDFYQWAGQFFVKYPKDGSEVPWHQDSEYWPLKPMRCVTVWLAIFDTNETNAAMRVVRRSHKNGAYLHKTNNAPNYVLEQEVSNDQFNHDDIVTLSLKAGEISIHDSGLLHGSGPNNSDRLRAGVTMRYCPTRVKCDLAEWPTFESYMARGKDKLRLNPEGPIPQGETYPVRKFQHSSEIMWAR